MSDLQGPQEWTIFEVWIAGEPDHLQLDRRGRRFGHDAAHTFRHLVEVPYTSRMHAALLMTQYQNLQTSLTELLNYCDVKERSMSSVMSQTEERY